MAVINRINNANSLNLRIESYAHVRLNSTWSSKNTINDFSMLYFIKSGDGVLYHYDKVIPLLPGRVYIIPSGCVCSHSCTSLEKIYMHFSLLTEEKYDYLSCIDGIYSLEFPPSRFEEMLSHMDENKAIDVLFTRALTMEYIYRFLDVYSLTLPNVKNYSDRVRSIIQYVNSNCNMELCVGDISKSLSLSESTVRKSFYKETGMSLGRYINDMIINRARSLLLDEKLTVKQVSDKLKFCDQYYFSRHFKKNNAATPLNYRKSRLGK